MEVPDGARRHDGVWTYVPTLPAQPSFTLAASDFTPDHTLCARGGCRPLRDWIGGSGPVTFSACRD